MVTLMKTFGHCQLPQTEQPTTMSYVT